MQSMPSSMGMPPVANTTLPSATRGRLALIGLPLLILALIGAGVYLLQIASLQGIRLGYPTPGVHISSTIPNSVTVGQPLTFSATGRGRDLTYSWDFGDGNSATGVVVNHTYQQVNESGNFSYTVSVTVVDVLNRRSTDSLTIRVMPSQPVANFNYTEETGYYGYNQCVDFDASSSTLGTSSAIYHWNFGDGYTYDAAGPTTTHCYYTSNIFTVNLYVTDGANQDSSVTTQTVTVQ